jgi:hypothetical protein
MEVIDMRNAYAVGLAIVALIAGGLIGWGSVAAACY